MLPIEAIQHLYEISEMSVHSADKSVGYGLLNELLEEHKRLHRRGDFLIFPQLRLRWNPSNPRDFRSNLPDLGFGRLIPPNDRLYIQGGAKHKRPVLPLMSGLPLPMTVLHSFDVRNAFAVAAKQASDQVKAAIKNGAVPQDEVISWVISIGPYFIVKNFGPFNQAELDTRGHRPNPSGDAGVTEAIEETLEQNRIQILEPIYLIGTPVAATAVVEFLQNGRRLYISNNVIGEHLCDEYYYPYYDALNTCKTHVSFLFQLHYCAGPFSHIPGTVLFKIFGTPL